MKYLIPPKSHTSINWCETIKDEWTDFVTLASASGFTSLNQFVNHVLLQYYIENQDKLGKKPTKFILDYQHDNEELMRKKIEPLSNGGVYDQYDLISKWKRFYEIEMKKRGMNL